MTMSGKTSKKIFFGAFALVFIFSAGFVVENAFELRKPGIVVLLYHQIVPDSVRLSSKYLHHVGDFKRQMEYLGRNNYKTILPMDISRSSIKTLNMSKTIMISFDDGSESHYTYAYPILHANHLSGLFFAVAKGIGKKGCLTADQLLEMEKNGMEIGSHTFSHPFLDQLDSQRVFMQLNQSKTDLEKILGINVESFAAPGGWYNKMVVAIAARIGYRYFFGCEIGTNDLHKGEVVFKRIEVTGAMTEKEFERLLHPRALIIYKTIQSLKFMVHDIIGSRNYAAISNF
jgi:peptidoglycan/xylan/chitin deacetylase (PgdA/CDA1 family)